MARVTVEDCLEALPNRFALVILGSKRTKQLLSGYPPLIEKPKNKEIIIALREIAAEKVIPDNLPKSVMLEKKA